MRVNKRTMAVLLAVVAVLSATTTVSANGAGGVTGAAFYVDGQVYQTVGTPTDLSNTRAPDDSYDTIYALQGEQPLDVAEAAPGDQDYNGGRWMVQVVTFTDYNAAVAAHDANLSGDFDSAEEVEAAIAAGDATVASGPKFVCPVIKL